MYAEHVRDLALRDVKVVWGENTQDYWGHALEAHHVDGLTMRDFEGQAGSPGLEAEAIE